MTKEIFILGDSSVNVLELLQNFKFKVIKIANIDDEGQEIIYDPPTTPSNKILLENAEYYESGLYNIFDNSIYMLIPEKVPLEYLWSGINELYQENLLLKDDVSILRNQVNQLIQIVDPSIS